MSDAENPADVRNPACVHKDGPQSVHSSVIAAALDRTAVCLVASLQAAAYHLYSRNTAG